MPYKLRKAPKRDLYWVVGEDGTKHSKEPIPKERAEAQMKALYIAMRKKRGGNVANPLAPSCPVKGGATLKERGMAAYLRERYYFGDKSTRSKTPLGELLFGWFSSVVHSTDDAPMAIDPYVPELNEIINAPDEAAAKTLMTELEQKYALSTPPDLAQHYDSRNWGKDPRQTLYRYAIPPNLSAFAAKKKPSAPIPDISKADLEPIIFRALQAFGAMARDELMPYLNQQLTDLWNDVVKDRMSKGKSKERAADEATQRVVSELEARAQTGEPPEEDAPEEEAEPEPALSPEAEEYVPTPAAAAAAAAAAASREPTKAELGKASDAYKRYMNGAPKEAADELAAFEAKFADYLKTDKAKKMAGNLKRVSEDSAMVEATRLAEKEKAEADAAAEAAKASADAAKAAAASTMAAMARPAPSERARNAYREAQIEAYIAQRQLPEFQILLDAGRKELKKQTDKFLAIDKSAPGAKEEMLKVSAVIDATKKEIDGDKKDYQNWIDRAGLAAATIMGYEANFGKEPVPEEEAKAEFDRRLAEMRAESDTPPEEILSQYAKALIFLKKGEKAIADRGVPREVFESLPDYKMAVKIVEVFRDKYGTQYDDKMNIGSGRRAKRGGRDSLGQQPQPNRGRRNAIAGTTADAAAAAAAVAAVIGQQNQQNQQNQQPQGNQPQGNQPQQPQPPPGNGNGMGRRRGKGVGKSKPSRADFRAARVHPAPPESDIVDIEDIAVNIPPAPRRQQISLTPAQQRELQGQTPRRRNPRVAPFTPNQQEQLRQQAEAAVAAAQGRNARVVPMSPEQLMMIAKGHGKGRKGKLRGGYNPAWYNAVSDAIIDAIRDEGWRETHILKYLANSHGFDVAGDPQKIFDNVVVAHMPRVVRELEDARAQGRPEAAPITSLTDPDINLDGYVFARDLVEDIFQNMDIGFNEKGWGMTKLLAYLAAKLRNTPVNAATFFNRVVKENNRNLFDLYSARGGARRGKGKRGGVLDSEQRNLFKNTTDALIRSILDATPRKPKKSVVGKTGTNIDTDTKGLPPEVINALPVKPYFRGRAISEWKAKHIPGYLEKIMAFENKKKEAKTAGDAIMNDPDHQALLKLQREKAEREAYDQERMNPSYSDNFTAENLNKRNAHRIASVNAEVDRQRNDPFNWINRALKSVADVAVNVIPMPGIVKEAYKLTTSGIPSHSGNYADVSERAGIVGPYEIDQYGHPHPHIFTPEEIHEFRLQKEDGEADERYAYLTSPEGQKYMEDYAREEAAKMNANIDKWEAEGIDPQLAAYEKVVGMGRAPGGLAPSAPFRAQLEKAGIEPSAYLAEAKRRAKEHGYPFKLLGFASDGSHKLAIPDKDGRMVAFGKVKYGDHIIYSHLEKHHKVRTGTAASKKNTFQKSHSKMKGNWASNPFSANNLALKILW